MLFSVTLFIVAVMTFFGKCTFYMFYMFFFFFFFFNILKLAEYNFFFFFFVDILSYLMVILSMYIVYLMYLSVCEGVVMMSLNSLFLLMFLMVCFMSDSLLQMYLFFESSLFPLLLLLYLKGVSPERFMAGMYLLLFTLVGSFVFLVQISLFFNGVSLFSSHYLILMSLSGSLWGFMFSMFLVKFPMYGVHFWLPKAHVEAPVTGSMILAGVMLKLGGYGMLRLIMFLNVFSYYFLQVAFMVVGLMGALFISFCCMRQIDVKMLIAYSSVSHLGLVLGGILSTSFYGIYGGVMLMVAHGLCSSGLFYTANIFYSKYMTRNMVLMKGGFYNMSIIIYGWILLLMMNMGVPLTMNFFSEIMISIGLLKFSLLSFFFIGMIFFMNVGYSLVMLMRFYHGHMYSMGVCIKEFMLNYLIIFLHGYLLLYYLFFVDFFMVWLFDYFK